MGKSRNALINEILREKCGLKTKRKTVHITVRIDEGVLAKLDKITDRSKDKEDE